MPTQPILSRLSIVLVAAAVATLGGCVGDNVATTLPPAAAAAPPAAVASAEPAAAPAGRRTPASANNRRKPADPVAEQQPVEPLTEEQASAQCWMHFEKGRRSIDLDARAKLVDQCIADKMREQAAR